MPDKPAKERKRKQQHDTGDTSSEDPDTSDPESNGELEPIPLNIKPEDYNIPRSVEDSRLMGRKLPRERLRTRKAEKSQRRRDRKATKIASGELAPDWRDQKEAKRKANRDKRKARRDALAKFGKGNVKAQEKVTGGKGTIDWESENAALDERKKAERAAHPKKDWKQGDWGYY